MEEFLTTYEEELHNSGFYFEYIREFPEANMENISNILISLFEQLYLGTEYIENFTIMSYATGQGFMEACFAYWLIKTGKCKTCNIVYSDPVISVDDLRVYNIFTNIVNYMDGHNLYSTHSGFLNNYINGNRKRKVSGIINLYKDTIPNILLSFAGQDYICSCLKKCKHLRIMHEYINLMNNVSLIVFERSILTSNMLFSFINKDLYIDINTLANIHDVLKDKEHIYSQIINEKMDLGNYIEKSFSTISELFYITRLSYGEDGFSIIENLDALTYLSKYRFIKEKLK